MCGICGFIGDARPDVLKRMRDALVHRGPDDSGSYVDGRVQLGHRRLSVIDLAHGQQPFESHDGSIVVIFNGEIYNHGLLRDRLEAKGHRYRTHCDTESIVHAYQEYGEKCPEHLDGMFAFVLHDRAKGILFGARDRFGKKPFFYGLPRERSGRCFVFASEIRSLLLHPAVSREATVSRRGVMSYLLHDYSPGELTTFEGIHKLLPGHAFRLTVDREAPLKLDCWRYWQNPIETATSSGTSLGESAAIAELDRRFDAAVERRLMTDVPLGVFLSGGIDSSAVVAFMSRHVPPSEIQTFSIGFDEASFDESPYSDAAARYYGTKHRSRICTAEEALGEMRRCFEHMDEPLADPSLIPSSLLARFARETVTVSLGGDGGDELFAGYDPFRAIAPARLYSAVVPGWLDRSLSGLASRLLPNPGSNMSPAFRVNRFLRGAKVPEEERMATWMGAFDPAGVAALVDEATSDEIRREFFESERSLLMAMKSRSADAVRLGLAYFQSFYLVDDILVKADRASMMHSLELRSPFLDTELAEFVNGLPSQLKYHNGKTKYLLKKMLGRTVDGRPMVPDRLLSRPKKGFGVPVARWIRQELREEFRSKLLSDWPGKLDFLSVKRIEEILRLHNAGSRDYGKELWALFVLGEWARQWA
jgi:asparagine synthase (glutamine-hydrolysing)